ncbi:hypothetical protein D9M71_669530 [compost metagenome]
MQLVQGIYRQLPNVAHDLKNQVVAVVLSHQPLRPSHQFQLVDLDALAEFAHNAAVLLELNYTNIDVQQFQIQVVLAIAGYHAWWLSHD